MSKISEYEASRVLEFFRTSPETEKKLISIAKTITKNTLTHLAFNGEFDKLMLISLLTQSHFRRQQDRVPSQRERLIDSQS